MTDSAPPSAAGSSPVVRRAFVHIGLPKTGTTSFQRALFVERQRLHEHGVRVLVYDGPDDQLAPATRAFDLANCVVRSDLDVWWRAYLPESALPEFVERGRASIRQQATSNERDLVASVEDLFLIRTPAEVDRLIEILAPRQVHVVLVVRDRREWLTSLRAQLLNAGIRPYSTWSNSCSNLSPDSWLCDVEGLVDMLEGRLGRDRVTVIDYDEQMAERGSVLPALWSACGLPATLLDDDPSASKRAWVNRSADWTTAADPPIGVVDELEWLRARVVEQALEVERLRRRYSVVEQIRRRWKARR